MLMDTFVVSTFDQLSVRKATILFWGRIVFDNPKLGEVRNWNAGMKEGFLSFNPSRRNHEESFQAFETIDALPFST